MINVCDAVMGTGKTTAAINYMNMHPEKRFLYVTPYVSETKRIQNECTGAFVIPVDDDPKFGCKKSAHLQKILLDGRNVAITHKLFSLSSTETIWAIRDNAYTVILDEVIDVFEDSGLTESDMNLIKATGWFDYKDVSGGMEFVYDAEKIGEEYRSGRFKDFFVYARSHRVVNIHADQSSAEDEKFYYWTLPVELFTSAEDVFVMTFMFHGSWLRAFFDMHRINYRYIGVVREKFSGMSLFGEPAPIPADYMDTLRKIHVEQSKIYNSVGTRYYALSARWFKNASSDGRLQALSKSTENYFRNKHGAMTDQVMWSVPSHYKDKFLIKRYHNKFLAFNTKATNDHAACTYLAYCINVFMSPNILNYLNSHGAELTHDEYALSNMIQWIWRSAIRKDQEIWLYLPSKRMRMLFEQWIDDISNGRDIQHLLIRKE